MLMYYILKSNSFLHSETQLMCLQMCVGQYSLSFNTIWHEHALQNSVQMPGSYTDGLRIICVCVCEQQQLQL